MSGRRRWLVLVLAVLGAVAATYALRDQPRRWLAAGLEQRLDATVEIGGLEILGRRWVRLRDVTVRGIAAYPWIERLDVGTIDAEGPILEMLDGRFERLVFRDVEARVDPARRAPDATPADLGALRIGRLEVERGRLWVAGIAEPTALAARLDDVGGNLGGEIELESRELALGALLAPFALPPLAAPAGDARLELVLATIDTGLRLTARGRLPAIENASGSLVFDPGGRPATVDLELRGIELAPWVEANLADIPGVLTLAGRADVEVAGAPDGELRYRLGGRLAALDWRDGDAELVADSLAAELEGALRRDAGGWEGPLASRLEGNAVRTARGALRLDGPAAPRAASFDGTLRLGEQARIDGELELWTVGAGRLTASGSASLGVEPPVLDLDWRLAGGELGILEDVARGLVLAPAAEDGGLAPALSALSAVALAGRVDLRGTARGPLDALMIQAELSASAGISARDGASGWQLRGARVRGELAWAPEGFTSAQIDVVTPSLASGDGARLLRGKRMTADLVRSPEGSTRLHWVLATPELVVAAPGRRRWTLSGRHVVANVSQRLDGATFGRLELAAPILAAGDGWRAHTERAELEITRRSGVSGLRFDLAPSALTLETPRLRAIAAVLRASGTLDPVNGTLELTSARLDAGDLGRLTLDGPVWPPAALAARLSVEEAGLAPWLDALGPIVAERVTLVPAGFAVDGRLAAVLDLRRGDGGSGDGGLWRAAGRATLDGAGLRSDDGARVVEGLAAAGELELGAATGGDVEVAFHGRGGGFMLLWDTLFADYGDRLAELELGVRLATAGAASPWRARARIETPAGALLHARLADGLEYELSLAADDLGAVIEEDLRVPLQGSLPMIDGLRMSGRLAATLAGRWVPGGARAARGELRLEAVDADAPTAAVDGLDLVLPLDLEWRPEGTGTVTAGTVIAGEERRGRLRFAGLRAAGVDFAPIESELLVAGDAVRLAGNLEAPLLGGVLGLERLALVDLLRPSRRMVAGLRLAGLDLHRLTEGLGLPPLAGRLDGYFPTIRLDGEPFGERFQVEGDGMLEVFGGQMRLFDISGRELLSRYPRLTFSADFTDVDLSQVTETFSFGAMSGRVEGRIRDCELFRAVPVTCSARLTSIEEKTVPRRLSLKAVNNLSILGTGGAVVPGGLARFFRRFTYDKLGIEIRLRDDRILLRGLEKRGGKELFLKGRLPFSIDVVNAQPGRTVSLRALLERFDQLKITRGNPRSNR